MTESPRAYRENNPYTPPPPEYKPPSLIAEHWKLATLLALVCVAFAVYCFKSPQSIRATASTAPSEQLPPPARDGSPPQPPPPPGAPIYIEAIPQEHAPNKP